MTRYYRGILFLTTNRVRTFDEAFQSRIHLSLHYNDLDPDARRQIWIAFLKKAHTHSEATHVQNTGLSEEELDTLAQKDLNGRQIKNTCRTATSLAKSRGQKLKYEHLEEALNAMEEFLVEFASMKALKAK